MPKEVELPLPVHREVARVYVERRRFPAMDVLEAVETFAQPGLLVTEDETVDSVGYFTKASPGTSTIVGPFPRRIAR